MVRRLSRTALDVAGLLLFADTHSNWNGLVDTTTAAFQRELLRATGQYRWWNGRLYEVGILQRLSLTMDRWLLDSQLQFMVLRKRFFEDEVVAELEAGAKQLVILGCGFDTLGLRMSRQFKDVQVWDVDLPRMIERRHKGHERLESPPPSNYHLLDADLTRTASPSNEPSPCNGSVGVEGSNPLQDLCRTDLWSPKSETVFVAEGLLMYLDEPSVLRLVSSLQQITAGQGAFFFSHLSLDNKGHPRYGPHSWMVRFGLRSVGEPMKWGIHPDSVADWGSQFDMLPHDCNRRSNLVERYSKLSTVHEGQTLGLPEQSIEFLAGLRWGPDGNDQPRASSTSF